MIKPKVVLLIFVSGKIVLTGAKVIPFQDGCLDSTHRLVRLAGSRRDIHRLQHHLYSAGRIQKTLDGLFYPLPPTLRTMILTANQHHSIRHFDTGCTSPSCGGVLPSYLN